MEIINEIWNRELDKDTMKKNKNILFVLKKVFFSKKKKPII